MIQAAGPLFFRACLGAGSLFALPGFAGAAEADPAAAYYSTVHEARPGDAFEVSVTVSWPGEATAFDIPVPEPHAPDGLHFRMLGTETEHDEGESRVRFRWQMHVEQPGRFALPDLLPVTAYPAASPTPIPVRTDMPATIEVGASSGGAGRLGRLALLGLALGVGGGGAVAWARAWRSRPAASHIADAAAIRSRLLAELDAARAHRQSGTYLAYVDALVGVARALEQTRRPSPATDELLALRERIAYASYQPCADELDAVEAALRRSLAEPSTPPSHEQKEASS